MSEYPLPEAFNQKGNHFVDNAVKLTQKHFDDVLAEASRDIPPDMIARFVRTDGRG